MRIKGKKWESRRKKEEKRRKKGGEKRKKNGRKKGGEKGKKGGKKSNKRNILGSSRRRAKGGAGKFWAEDFFGMRAQLRRSAMKGSFLWEEFPREPLEFPPPQQNPLFSAHFPSFPPPPSPESPKSKEFHPNSSSKPRLFPRKSHLKGTESSQNPHFLGPLPEFPDPNPWIFIPFFLSQFFLSQFPLGFPALPVISGFFYFHDFFPGIPRISWRFQAQAKKPFSPKNIWAKFPESPVRNSKKIQPKIPEKRAKNSSKKSKNSQKNQSPKSLEERIKNS